MQEVNLINAVTILASYNVSLLPLQVRRYEDKLELIQKVLDTAPK